MFSVLMLSVAEIVLVTLAAAAIAAVAQYVFKKNVKKFGFNRKELIDIFTNRAMLAGLALYFLSLLLYLYALHAAPIISFVYPVFASTFIFVLLISKFVLGERIIIPRVIGMAMIIIGIIVISFTL